MEDQSTSTHRYEPGEIVNITIRGARIHAVTRSVLEVELATYDVAGLPVSVTTTTIPIAARGVDVERVAPAGGPIQIGDIWEDRHGERWFARCGATGLTVVPEGNNTPTSPENLARWYSPLKLVYRHEPEPTPEPCAYPGDTDGEHDHDECRGAVADAAEDTASRYTHPAVGDCDDACADEREAAGTCRHTDGDDL